MRSAIFFYFTGLEVAFYFSQYLFFLSMQWNYYFWMRSREYDRYHTHVYYIWLYIYDNS